MAQVVGIPGKLVEGMIKRSCRSRFRNLYWNKPSFQKEESPFIFACNHHGWFDGYIMFLAALELRIEVVDWIQEFDAFPLFRFVGGMPFPADRPEQRLATIRQTKELLRNGKSLILFAEGVLHCPPEILPLGSAALKIGVGVPNTKIVPVGLHYEMSMHERPECYVSFGTPTPANEFTEPTLRQAIEKQVDNARQNLRSEQDLQILFKGTLDVNERWDVRAKFGKK